MDGLRSRGRFRCLAFVFRRAHPRVTGANVSVYPRSSKAVRESENRGECRCGCKAAWYRRNSKTPKTEISGACVNQRTAFNQR